MSMPSTYENYVAYSRIIASFASTGLNPRKNLLMFKCWLSHLHLPDYEISEIVWIVENGKRELEDDASRFVEAMSNCIEVV